MHDYEQVFFYVCANVDPKRDVLLSEGPIDQLDHATTLQAYGGKIGFDATAKGPAEGARGWPPEIEMSAEIRARVDARLGRVRDRAARRPGKCSEWRRGSSSQTLVDATVTSLT